jgi:hypothetical protein
MQVCSALRGKGVAEVEYDKGESVFLRRWSDFVYLKLDDLLALGVGADEAEHTHAGLSARVGEANHLHAAGLGFRI